MHPRPRCCGTTKNSFTIGLAGLLFILACGSAHADIRILKSNGQPVPAAAASKIFNNKTGGWDITLSQLYAPYADSVFEIHADAGEIIDNVTSNVNGPAAGSPVIIRLLGDAPGYLRTVRNVIQKGSAETILNKVNVTEDIGSVQVEAIGDLIAGRDIIGPITATTSDNSIRGITSAQAGRNILGNLAAEHGRILLVYSSGGNVGMANSPITIRAKYAVYQVEAKDVYADINTRVNGGTGGFFALVCDRFAGTLTTEQLILNQYIPLDGLILIRQQFTGTISIGKSYTSPTQYIQVPLNGLGGQIIINADNAANGAWTAPVRVGPQGDPNQIVLNSPNYVQTPAVLGGGSVGLVPFKLHSQACSPANGATVQLSSSAPPLIAQLRHYGPVNTTGSAPLTIERRPAGTSQAYLSLPSTDFSISVSDSNSNIIIIGPAPGKPGFAAGYEYRIRPTAQLRCAVTTAPTVQWTADYIFTVAAPPCIGDVNGDRIVNVNDLISIIIHWGPVWPAYPATDTNGDGQVNSTDLLAVIAHWGVCP